MPINGVVQGLFLGVSDELVLDRIEYNNDAGLVLVLIETSQNVILEGIKRCSDYYEGQLVDGLWSEGGRMGWTGGRDKGMI